MRFKLLYILLLHVVYCSNFTIKQNKRGLRFTPYFWLKMNNSVQKKKFPATINNSNVKIKTNDGNDNNHTTSVRINTVPTFPLTPASVAFLFV